MEQLQSTIGSVAREMLKNFTKRDNRNGRQVWDLREYVDWQQHIVMEAYGGRELCPEAYGAVFRILLEIYLARQREEAEEFLREIEPYDNVSELTTWLDSSSENIKYVNRALAENYSTNGITVLGRAHQLYLQDIGRKLIDAIERHIHQPDFQLNSSM